MPKVGKKHFSYDPSGIAAARAESAKTGVPMEVKQRYNVGGLLRTAANSPKKEWKQARGAGIVRGGAPYRIV